MKKLFSDLTLAGELLSVAYKVILTRDYQKIISWKTATVAIQLTKKVVENFGKNDEKFKIEDEITTHVFEILACGTTKLDFASSNCGQMASSLLSLMGSVKFIGIVHFFIENSEMKNFIRGLS